LSWDANPVAGVSYSVEARNYGYQGDWYPLGSTRQTSWLFEPPTYGIVWGFRVIARNMAGDSESVAVDQVSLPWLPYGSPPKYGFNSSNGADGAATLLAFAAECVDSVRQRVCFNRTVTGDQPSTIGNFLFYAGDKADFIKRVRCEAYQNAVLFRRSGAGAVNAVGQDLLRHEAIHSMQEGGFPLPAGGFGTFLAAYGWESLHSLSRTLTPWKDNAFEIQAGLERGGYQPFDDAQQLCSWWSVRKNF